MALHNSWPHWSSGVELRSRADRGLAVLAPAAHRGVSWISLKPPRHRTIESEVVGT
jgi:hypothetical protein